MKTVSNLDPNKSVNKQTSFRQSYTGVNSSSSNIAYASLTNSSNKPGNVSGNKEQLAKMQKQHSKKMLAGSTIDGTVNSGLNQMFDDKIRDYDNLAEGIDSTAVCSGHDNKALLEGQNDVEMEVQDDKNHDMDVDGNSFVPQPDQKSPIKYKSEVPLTDDQKLDYFHSVIVPNSRSHWIEEDVKTAENSLECSEYATEIFTHLKNTELEYIAKPGYMKNQNDINEKMRAILIDWLVEVHLKFKLYPETLYLTVNLIDRYLEKENVMRQHLQLVGVTSMLIASKYEEIYAPEVRDFVYITDKAYTKEEILSMEYKMLTKINFNVTTPSSYRFLERIFKLCPEADERVFNLSRYLIELSLVEYRMLKHHPSMLASAALFLSMKVSI